MMTKEKVSQGQGGLVFSKLHIAKARARGSRRPEEAWILTKSIVFVDFLGTK